MSTLDHAFFYNSQDGDRLYDAESFEYWLKKFFTTGVFEGDLQVVANDDMTVSVCGGYANVDGKVRFFGGTQVFTLETANATYDRIDTVVVERNDTDRDVTAYVVTGGYSSTPVATEPIRENGVYQLVLAQIYVAAGVVSISQAEITDTRMDTKVCGVVTGTVTEYDFDQFTAQFESWSTQQKADFLEWLASTKNEITEYNENMQAEFDEWFQSMKDQLTEDAAGNLQLQIDNAVEADDDIIY